MPYDPSHVAMRRFNVGEEHFGNVPATCLYCVVIIFSNPFRRRVAKLEGRSTRAGVRPSLGLWLQMHVLVVLHVSLTLLL